MIDLARFFSTLKCWNHDTRKAFGNGMNNGKAEFGHIGALACILALVVSSGCVAIGTRIIHSEPFAGVKTDYALCFHRDGISPECRINPVFAVIDAPFSLVVDVCFLPFEIGHHAGHSLWNPPAIKEDQEAPGTNIPNQASQAIGAPQPGRCVRLMGNERYGL